MKRNSLFVLVAAIFASTAYATGEDGCSPCQLSREIRSQASSLVAGINMGMPDIGFSKMISMALTPDYVPVKERLSQIEQHDLLRAVAGELLHSRACDWCDDDGATSECSMWALDPYTARLKWESACDVSVSIQGCPNNQGPQVDNCMDALEDDLFEDIDTICCEINVTCCEEGDIDLSCANDVIDSWCDTYETHLWEYVDCIERIGNNWEGCASLVWAESQSLANNMLNPF